MGFKDSDLQFLGYTTRRELNLTLICKPALPGLWDMARSTGPLGKSSPLQGRAAIRIIEPDLVVRTLMHGGLFRHITGKNFLSPARTVRELKVSAYLSLHGIPTPEILAVRIMKHGFFSRIEVVSRLVPDSVDLLTWLESPRTDSGDLMEKAGRIIRRIHDLGIYHADLHIKNLLLDAGKDLWVLDLDKAYRYDSLPAFLKGINVRRFLGSVKKWLKKGRIHLENDWEESFLKGYGAT